VKLAPLQLPGMPTVSNSKSSASRSLIRSMQLLLKVDSRSNPYDSIIVIVISQHFSGRMVCSTVGWLCNPTIVGPLGCTAWNDCLSSLFPFSPTLKIQFYYPCAINKLIDHLCHHEPYFSLLPTFSLIVIFCLS